MKCSLALASPLGSEIWKEYTKLSALISQIPDTIFFRKDLYSTRGNVSVANIIAYQIGWGKLLMSWYEKGLKKQPFTMPGEGFVTWDYVGLAQHFYHTYETLNRTDLEIKFLNVVTKIIHITEHEHATGHLDAIGVWPWCTLKSGKKWPLSKWITVNTIAPYKRAIAIIKKERIL